MSGLTQRKGKAGKTTAGQAVERSEAQPPTSISRPRTRARAREEAELEIKGAPEPRRPRSSQPQEQRQPSPQNTIRLAQNKTTQAKRKTQASRKAPERETQRVQGRGKSVSVPEKVPRPPRRNRAPQTGVAAWIEQIGKPSLQAPPYYSESDTMSTSAGISRKTKSTAKGIKLLNKLKRRGVSDQRLTDSRIVEYKRLVTSLPVPEPTDLRSLKALLNKLARRSQTIKVPGDDVIHFFEDILNEFSDWSMTARLPSISKRNFISDVELCTQGNEYILHRTLMMTIVDRYHLNNRLAINCEGLWQTEPLPLMRPYETEEELEDVRLHSPKPDLAVFFAGKAFGIPTEHVQFPVPTSMEKSIYPEGDMLRCFPFFFLEAKAREISLEQAEQKNLHSTSQALFNIHKWLRTANMETEFFRDVRVFSLVMNSRTFRIRVHHAHRARKEKIIKLEYTFDEVCDERIDDRKEYFCATIHNVLHDYGIKILLPILKKAYDTIVVPSLASSEPTTSVVTEAGPSGQPIEGASNGERTVQVVQDTDTEGDDQDVQDSETDTESSSTPQPPPKRKLGRGRPKGTTKKARTSGSRSRGQTQPVTDSFIEEVGNI